MDVLSFKQNLLSVYHDESILNQCQTFPQESNPMLDGGLYMLHGISCFIDYMHIEDSIFNDCSLKSKMTWKKSDVPKIRNVMFRKIAERVEFTPWHTKLANHISNSQNS